MFYARKILNLCFFLSGVLLSLASWTWANVLVWQANLTPEGFVFDQSSSEQIRGIFKDGSTYFVVFRNGEIWIKNGDSVQSLSLGHGVLAPVKRHPWGGLLVLTEDCQLYRVSPEGEIELLKTGWGYCPFPPQVQGMAIGVATSEGLVAVLDPLGRVYWWKEVPGLSGTPVWLRDLFLVPAGKRLLALREGKIWWEAEAPSGWRIYGSPAVRGDQVWVILVREGHGTNALLAKLRLGEASFKVEKVWSIPVPKSPLGVGKNGAFYVSSKGLVLVEEKIRVISEGSEETKTCPGIGEETFLWSPIENGGDLWFVSLEGCLRQYDGQKLSSRYFTNQIYSPLSVAQGLLLVGVKDQGHLLWQMSVGAYLLAELEIDDHPALTLFSCPKQVGLWPVGSDYWLYNPLTNELSHQPHQLAGLEEVNLKDFTLPVFGLPECEQGQEPLFPDLRDPTTLGSGGWGGRVSQVLQGDLSTYRATMSECDPDKPKECKEKKYYGLLLGEGLYGEPLVFQKAGPFYAPLGLYTDTEEYVLAANRNHLVYVFSSSGIESGRFLMGGAGLVKPEVVSVYDKSHLVTASIDGFVHYYPWEERKFSKPGVPPAYSCDAGAPITGAIFREHRVLAGTVNGDLVFIELIKQENEKNGKQYRCRLRSRISLKEVSLQELTSQEEPPLYWVMPLSLEKNADQHWVALVALTTWSGEPYTLIAQVDLTDKKIKKIYYEGETSLRGRPAILGKNLFFLISP